jgi:hypothetical protein
MIIRPKDHIYWEPIFGTQEEAQAFKDYWELVFVRGYVENAYFQHEQETFTG